MEVTKQEAEEWELVDCLGRRKWASIIDASTVADDPARAPPNTSDTIPPPRRDSSGWVLNHPRGSVEIPRDRDCEHGKHAAGRCQALSEPRSDRVRCHAERRHGSRAEDGGQCQVEADLRSDS